MKNKFYAHSLEGKPTEEWQPLDFHVKNVAQTVRKVPQEFNAGDWGYLAGLWCDLGKYSDAHKYHLHRGSGRLMTRKTVWVKRQVIYEVLCPFGEQS